MFSLVSMSPERMSIDGSALWGFVRAQGSLLAHAALAPAGRAR